MRRNNSFIIAGIGLFALSSCGNEETFRQSWFVPVDGKAFLLTHTNYYSGGKSTSSHDYFRIINTENGEIKGEADYNVRYNSINNKFVTPTSLFIQYNQTWECRKLKDLSLRWDGEGLKKLLRKKNKAVKKIHEVHFYNDTFRVTNTVGEMFAFSRAELEGINTKPIVVEIPPRPYTTSESRVGYMNKPMDSVTYAKIQPVFADYRNRLAVTVPGTILLLEGEQRKMLKFLDTTSLNWVDVFPGKLWLQADFLRFHSEFSDYGNTGSAISSGNVIFIYYHNSLDKEEDKTHLAAIDISTGKVVWKFQPEEHEMDNEFKPQENYVLQNKLLTVWTGPGRIYRITSINIKTGKKVWQIEK